MLCCWSSARLGSNWVRLRVIDEELVRGGTDKGRATNETTNDCTSELERSSGSMSTGLTNDCLQGPDRFHRDIHTVQYCLPLLYFILGSEHVPRTHLYQEWAKKRSKSVVLGLETTRRMRK